MMGGRAALNSGNRLLSTSSQIWGPKHKCHKVPLSCTHRKANLRGTGPAGLEEEQIEDLSASGNHHLQMSKDGTTSQTGIHRSSDLANESIQ